jgi:hypothetical protein
VRGDGAERVSRCFVGWGIVEPLNLKASPGPGSSMQRRRKKSAFFLPLLACFSGIKMPSLDL